MPKFSEPCDHRTISGHCPECHEHLRCPHGKTRSGGYRHKQSCVQCSAGSANVCKHGKLKKDCGKCSSRQCVHVLGRLKHNCIICTPSRACPHKAGRRKDSCLLCTPSQRCPHVEKCAACVDLDECHHSLKWKNKCVLCSPHLACQTHHPTEHTRGGIAPTKLARECTS